MIDDGFVRRNDANEEDIDLRDDRDERELAGRSQSLDDVDAFPGALSSNYDDISPVMDDKQLMSSIIDLVLLTTRESLDEIDSECVPSHLGVRAFQLRAKYGGILLFPLNWERDDVQGQTRFLNRVDYPFPIRLIFSSGRKDSGSYLVCPKGNNTRNAARENWPWTPQESLFGTEKNAKSIQTLWIWINVSPLQTGGAWVTITIGLPYALNRGGTKMAAIGDRTIFNGPITLGGHGTPALLPPPAPIDVQIHEIHGEHLENGTDPTDGRL